MDIYHAVCFLCIFSPAANTKSYHNMISCSFNCFISIYLILYILGDIVMFTRQGGIYENNDYDLKIVVPSDAVGEDEVLEMKVLPQLIGQFSIPEKYTIITLYYYIILNLPLKKPVQIFMGHCLEMPVYQKSREVVILRADHNITSGSNQHYFEPILNPDISDTYPILSFELQNFCILCAALEMESTDSALQLLDSKTASCGIVEVPKPMKRCRALYAVILYEPYEAHAPFYILIYVCPSCKGAIKVRLTLIIVE